MNIEKKRFIPLLLNIAVIVLLLFNVNRSGKIEGRSKKDPVDFFFVEPFIVPIPTVNSNAIRIEKYINPINEMSKQPLVGDDMFGYKNSAEKSGNISANRYSSLKIPFKTTTTIKKRHRENSSIYPIGIPYYMIGSGSMTIGENLGNNIAMNSIGTLPFGGEDMFLNPYAAPANATSVTDFGYGIAPPNNQDEEQNPIPVGDGGFILSILVLIYGVVKVIKKRKQLEKA